jgi:two-component system KDP operon response regulator KdpE
MTGPGRAVSAPGAAPGPGSVTGPGAAVLLVEDDAAARSAVATTLAARGFRVAEAVDGRSALRLWESSRPDLVLLDLGLPDIDGMAVLVRIRREAATPIIVLSARGQEKDRVAALDAGADDYLTKPFGAAELHSRIRAVLRRAAGPDADQSGVLRVGSVSLDVARRSVQVAGSTLDLTPREYELLKVLLAHTGRVVTSGYLLRAVWGSAYTEESHYIHVYVSRLRRKLAAADPTGDAGRIIVNEPGVGYRVVPPPADDRP